MPDDNLNPPPERTSKNPSAQPDLSDVVGSLSQGIFQTYEVQVLGTMGLLIGYICVFFAKILEFTNIYFGVAGVSLITLMLMLLNNVDRLKSTSFWIRTFSVIIICLLITAPQLYFSWTVSVAEIQSALESQHQRKAEAISNQAVQPNISFTNTK